MKPCHSHMSSIKCVTESKGNNQKLVIEHNTAITDMICVQLAVGEKEQKKIEETEVSLSALRTIFKPVALPTSTAPSSFLTCYAVTNTAVTMRSVSWDG